MKIFVTGSSRGIGKLLCEHFLDQGHQVAGLARSESGIQHDQYQHHQGEVNDEEAIQEVIRKLRASWGSVDVLINNAGVARMIPFALTPPQIAREVMEVNYMGTFTVTHAFLRLLRKSSQPRVVNLSSVAVPLRLEGEISYASAKSAVEEFTRIAAKELSQFGITCNAIGPCPIQTDLIAGVSEEKIEKLLQRQAIPQMATITDVINVIEFLINHNSHMVTGQVIYLGGAG